MVLVENRPEVSNRLDKAQVFFIPVLLLYFFGPGVLEYWMVSRADPMSKFLACSSLVSHPPSSVKPMESI